MWLFIVITFLFIISIIINIIYKKIDKFDFLGEKWFGGLDALFGLIFLFMIFCLLVVRTSSNLEIAKNTEIYNSLIYQIENDIYEDLDGEGKKQLYKEVQNWNSDLARMKKIRENKWIGIFVSEKVDSLKYIPIESIDNTGVNKNKAIKEKEEVS